MGGTIVEGRWHTLGHLVVYASEQPATAQLEWLAHLTASSGVYPKTIPFSEISVPSGIVPSEIAVDALPSGWEFDQRVTQRVGDDWLNSRSSALLFVPSVLVPHARNVLINPTHPDATEITVVNAFDFPLDPRLL